MAAGMLTVSQAVAALRAGAVIAYPTEAVYGLGCDPACRSAVQHVLELKQRPVSAGFILIADSFERLASFTAPVEARLLERALQTWPGPVTWLFPRAAHVADWLAGQHPTIALRVSAHPVCRELCAAFEGPLVSTSANICSMPPAQTVAEVEACFAGTIAGVVAGELGLQHRPSEIRDLATGRTIRSG